MKQNLTILSIITILFMTATYCSKEENDISMDEINIEVSKKSYTQPFFLNNPLPHNTDSLRILAIGNSYTEDGTAYIQEIADGLKISRNNYCVYSAIHSAASLEYWHSEISRNASHNITRIAGSITMDETAKKMKSIIKQPWDIIVLQQYSGDAINYSSYNPYLRNIISCIIQNCTNPNVSIAWQFIHSYKTGFSATYSNNYTRWKQIAYATAKMYVNDGIDIIIPTGTAIQNARNTTLNGPNELTRDGTHLCYGLGRYIAASAWVETLFSPVFHTDIRQSTALHPLYGYEQDGQQNPKINHISGSSSPVTESNKELCLTCAYHACQHPFNVYQKAL